MRRFKVFLTSLLVVYSYLGPILCFLSGNEHLTVIVIARSKLLGLPLAGRKH